MKPLLPNQLFQPRGLDGAVSNGTDTARAVKADVKRSDEPAAPAENVDPDFQKELGIHVIPSQMEEDAGGYRGREQFKTRFPNKNT